MSQSERWSKIDPPLDYARQLLYRFAALSLLDPQCDAWPRLHELRGNRLLSQAATLVRQCPAARCTPLAPGERPLADLRPDAVLSRLPRSPESHFQQYDSTFGLLVANACPPYELEYIPEKFTFQRSNAMADIAGFYRAFGLQISSQHRDRPDHVVFELEFMGLLIGLVRRADADPPPLRDERMGVCRRAQVRFLREHLAWWTPAFSRLLERENPDGYFAAAGRFLATLIAADRALLGIDRSTRPAAPSPIERPEACQGCELAVS